MSRLYETAAVLVLVAVVVYGLVRVISALLDSHTGHSSLQEASSISFSLLSSDITAPENIPLTLSFSFGVHYVQC